MTRLRIGTRGSALALWQANTVASLLAAAGTSTEVVTIRTAGDRLQEQPMTETGTKRLFVKEIQDALVRQEIDIAVHSAKDLPTDSLEGLSIAAVLSRGDPRDALVLPAGNAPADFETALPHLAQGVIGTSSVRRVAQLLALLPRAIFAPVRGNVDTRLRKLDTGQFQALVLAAAGLQRLGFDARISAAIPVERCVPAPGQGIVAIETRTGDTRAQRALAPINDESASLSLSAEREVVSILGGGCQLPLGAIAVHDGGQTRMLGIVTSLDGRQIVRREASGPTTDIMETARRLAGALADGGAGDILETVRAAAS